MPPNIKAFTVAYDGKARELVIECGVSLPLLSRIEKEFVPPPIFKVKALWDTGATASAITPNVAKELGLSPITKVNVNTASGVSLQNVYFVNIYLPNKVFIPFVKVTECLALAGNFEMLIGMDIITLGDFSITNVDRKTTFTFRVPSIETIDFVKDVNEHRSPMVADKKIGRNDPCFCGSGKKYKRCHGK